MGEQAAYYQRRHGRIGGAEYEETDKARDKDWDKACDKEEITRETQKCRRMDVA